MSQGERELPVQPIKKANGKVPFRVTPQISRRKQYELMKVELNKSINNTKVLSEALNRSFQLARVIAMELYFVDPTNEVFTVEGGLLTQTQIDDTARFVHDGEYDKIREQLKAWYRDQEKKEGGEKP